MQRRLRDATVYHPSVHLSIMLRYCSLEYLKIISRPNSLRSLLSLTPTWVIWSNGNTPKMVGSGAQKPAISPKWCKIGPRLLCLDGLIGSRIHAFDWCQSQLPRMTLNGQNVTLAEISKIYRACQKKISTKIDLYYWRQNVGQ